MLFPQFQLSLILIILAWNVQSRVIYKDYMQENIDKMRQLRERYNKIHPVTLPTYPPLSKEDEEFLKTLSQQKFEKDDPSILEINGDQATGLIEGDIAPSDADIAEMEDRLRDAEAGIASNSSDRTKRAASNIDQPNWPTDKPIPYYVTSEYSDEHKEMFRIALATFKENTCIEFAENGGGVGIEYYNGGGGCVSYIGNVVDPLRGHNQPISLKLPSPGSPGTCMTIKTIQHETMHALGFDHTQSRADRDQYVEVLREYIIREQIDNFELLKPTQFDNHTVPYEYNSVMHYESTAFSKGGATPVIIPWKHDYIASVGGTHGPTFNDWKQINYRYKCSEKCPRRDEPLSCLNNGYQHPRKCDRCACPIFFTGDHCENEMNLVQITTEDATPHIEDFARERRGNEDLMITFSSFDKDHRVIKAPEGRTIRINVNITDGTCNRECTNAAVEIVDEDLSLVGKRFCCATALSFVSTRNIVGYQVYAAPWARLSSRVTFSLEPTGAPATDGPATGTPVATTEAPTPVTEALNPQTTEGSGITEETTEGSGTTDEITEGSGMTGEATTESQTESPDTDATTAVDLLSSESPELNEDPSTDEFPFVYNVSTTSSIPPTEVPSTRESRIPSPRPTTAEEYTTYPSVTEQPITDQSKLREILDSIKSLLADIREKIDRLANSINW